MLGLGRKKAPSLDRFPADNWWVAQGESDGKAVIARINAAAVTYAGHPELPIRLGVTVSFQTPNEHGFCSKEEGEKVGKIEERLIEQLLSAKVGYPVLVITTNGMREFVFYVSDAEQARVLVSAVEAEGLSHPLQYGTVSDPDWSYFSQFA